MAKNTSNQEQPHQNTIKEEEQNKMRKRRGSKLIKEDSNKNVTEGVKYFDESRISSKKIETKSEKEETKFKRGFMLRNEIKPYQDSELQNHYKYKVENTDDYRDKETVIIRTKQSTIENQTKEIQEGFENLKITDPNGVYVPPHLKNQGKNPLFSNFSSNHNKTERTGSSWSRYPNNRIYEEDSYEEVIYDEMIYYCNERIVVPKQFPEIKCSEKIEPVLSFDELRLPSNLYERLKSFVPTPIQSFAIPAILKNRDVICRAPTGVGKTIAFLVPLILKLKQRRRPCLRVLILTPTRELALQIEKELNKLLSHKENKGDGCNILETTNLRGASLYGGTDIGHSKHKMSLGCDILIATPGRLCDFLERHIVNLRNVKFFVLDEADRMLEMGFEKNMEYIRSYLKNTLTYMFSATFDKRVKKIANSHLKSQICIEYERETQDNIIQEFVLEDRPKESILFYLIEENINDRILIFVETKVTCRLLEKKINSVYKCVSLHGDKTQRERELALDEFSTDKCQILVATSVAARGLDIPLINLVINYDLPHDINEYIHRIGRSGRCGQKGWSISIYSQSKNYELKNHLVEVLRESGNDIPYFLGR